MPLIGFFCEMTADPVSFKECLACARSKHPCQFTEEILEEMIQSSQGREHAGISITTCTGCQRQGFYNLSRDYYQFPNLLWPAIRGTAFHRLIESHPQDNAIYEHRYSRVLPSGFTLTGQPDKIIPSEELIIDYKSKDKVPKEIPEDYVWQINGYRLILADGVDMTTNEPIQMTISRLGLVWMTMMDVKKVAVEVKPLDEVLEYFDTRAKQIGEALKGGQVPPRKFRSPEISPFCTKWCPHLTQCRTDGI